MVQHRQHEHRVCWVVASLSHVQQDKLCREKPRWIMQTSAFILSQTAEEAVRAVMVFIKKKSYRISSHQLH